MKSYLEENVKLILNAARVQYETQYKFLEDRKFKFDFAIPSRKIAIEIQGGQWKSQTVICKKCKSKNSIRTGGAHNLPAAVQKNYEKLNLAQLNGWIVLQYGTDIIKKEPFKIIYDLEILNVIYK